jgi:uncharacterized repeat protein (TIGR01451 family)
VNLRPSKLSCHRCIAVVGTVVAVSALQSHQPRVRGASQPVSHLSSLSAKAETRVATAYGQLPLAFEQNDGQTAEEVRFLSRGAGYTLFLTSADAVLALRKTSPEGNRAGTVLRMKLRGGSPASRVAGRGELPGRTNYLIGRDPEKWRRGVARFEKVEYENVYPGVNLVYYGNQRQLEYDFIVSPGADPQRIRLAFDGTQALRIDDRGDLVLETRGDPVRLQKPVIYQEIDGRREQITGAYLLEDNGEVTFQVGSYDTTRPLVIDPVLVYSTYLGGTGHDLALDIAVDADGNAYVVGNTLSTDFPVNNAVQPSCTTIELPGYTSCDDMFVTKLNRDGTAIEYSTYIGGTNTDVGNGIAVDGSGNAYVTGATWSVDFPTYHAIQPDFRSNPSFFPEAFVAKLSSTGSELVYSTYLGGSDEDRGNAIAVDGQGSAYVTGGTYSFDFPTANPLQSAPSGVLDAFVAKLTADGSALAYSTFLGGQSYDIANDIAVTDDGYASITGETDSVDFPTVNASQPTNQGQNDAFIATVVPDGTALAHSSYLGGPGFDAGWRLAVANRIYYVTGTTSGDFPVTDGSQPFGGQSDAFLAIVNFEGVLGYSRYFGGSERDQGSGIAVDASGNVYVTGVTRSPDFPLTHAIQTYSGNDDLFIAKLNNALELVYSTYLGGQGVEVGTDTALLRGPSIAVDSEGNAYVTGATSSSDFPSTGAIFQPAFRGEVDAFVAKIFDDGSVEARADVSVIETETEEAEGEIRYLFTITNHGPSAASEVTFYNPLPFGVTFHAAFISTAHGGSGTCPQDGSTITCYLGAVPSGASAQIFLTFTSPTVPVVANTAVVTATESDPDISNNEISSTRPMPDLALGGSSEQHGSDLHYLFRMANFGPGRANAVRFTNVVPQGANVRYALFGIDTPTAPVISSCPIEEGIVTCGVDTMPPGATAFAEIVITPAAPGSLVSTGTVTSASPDYNVINNSVTLTTVFEEALADLSIAHSRSKNVVMVGDTLTYTFDVANNGPAEATDAFLNDTLSDAEALVSVTTNRGGCDNSSHVVYCSFGSMPAGAVARVTVVVNVISNGFLNNLVNEVALSSSVHDPNFENNVATIVTPVNRPPVANAGPDQLVSVGVTCQAPITLNGTGSSDPDGDTLTYTWTSAGVPPFPPIVLSGGTDAITGPTPAAPLPPGVYTIVLTLSDGRGGVASDTVVVTVRDTTPPVFVSVPAPITVEQSNPLGTVVAVPLPTATDNCPGPLFVTSDASPFSPPQPSLFPPGSTTVTFRTCDASCNRATATTTVTVVDTTRPSVTVVSPQARTYLHSDVLPISFSASDTGSGLAPGSPGAALDGIAVANGQSVALLTLGLGQHSLVVSAVDLAGNTASHPVNFQVIATVGSLITTVNVFTADGRISDSNTANGLLAKLNDAQDAIDKGKNNVAVNKLREFIDQVNGRAGRSIAPDAAQLLVTDAQYVIVTLQ